MRYPVIVPKKTLPPRKVKQLKAKNSSQSEEISVGEENQAIDEIDSTEISNKTSNEDLSLNSEKSLAENLTKKSEELRCRYCDKIQSNKSSLGYHISTVHLLQNPFLNEPDENTDPFVKKKQIENKDDENEGITIDNENCPHCESVFSRKLGLNEHIKNFHQNISSNPPESETESDILEKVNSTSENSDRREPALKLHKIKEIAFDSLTFSYVCQHLEKLPVIFKCKNENCEAYMIMQSFDDIQVKSYFEDHDCSEVLGSSTPVPASNLQIVKCVNLFAKMDVKKFKAGGIGNCIQLGKDYYIDGQKTQLIFF